MAYMTKMTEDEKTRFRAIGQTAEFFKCQWCGNKNPDYHRLWSHGRNQYSDIFGCEKCYKEWLESPPVKGVETPEVKIFGLGRIGNVKGSGEGLQDINA